jgi:hypothetical protein
MAMMMDMMGKERKERKRCYKGKNQALYVTSRYHSDSCSKKVILSVFEYTDIVFKMQQVIFELFLLG